MGKQQKKTQRQKRRRRRKLPKYKRPVSTKAAKKILREYYRDQNKRNVSKATRNLRRDMATKTPKHRVLKSKSPRSYLYRYRPRSRKCSGPQYYDMHGVDNKHRQYRRKKTYRKIRSYVKKTKKAKQKENTFVTSLRKALFLD